MYAPPPALNLVVLRCNDLEAARRFYSAMGLLMSLDRHGAGPLHYVSCVAGLVFELYEATTDHPRTQGVRLGFQVDTVDGVVEMLLHAGGSVAAAPRTTADGRHATVDDPDGNRIALFAPTDSHTVGPYLPTRTDQAGPAIQAQTALWSVWRQDDNGNRFEISTGHSQDEAERIRLTFEARGHKQMYWISPAD